jgi:hypothetical protein
MIYNLLLRKDLLEILKRLFGEENNNTLFSDILIPVLTILISILLAFIIPKWTINRERKHGKYQTLEIINRFYIAMFNSVDILPEGLTSAKKGEKDLEVLINSIKSIQMDFIEVSSNPFFLELLEKYPEFSMVKYLMSSYIIELQCYKKKTKINKLEIQYNAKLINNFKKLYDKIYKTLPKKRKDRGSYKQLNQIVIDFDKGFKIRKKLEKVNHLKPYLQSK